MNNQEPPASSEVPPSFEQPTGGTPAVPQPPSTKERRWLLMFVLMFGLLIFAAIMGRPWLPLEGFLCTWFAFAYFSLRAKQSAIVSIGGGFLAGLIVSVVVGEITIVETAPDGTGTGVAEVKQAPRADTNPIETVHTATNTVQTEPVKQRVWPMFRSSAESFLETFTAQAQKVEVWLNAVQHSEGLTVEEIGKLKTSEDIKDDIQSERGYLSKRTSEIREAHKGGNEYMKIAEDVEQGYRTMMFVIYGLENFAKAKPEKQPQAAQDFAARLENMRSCVRNVQARFVEVQSKAAASQVPTIEVVKRSEYENWLNQAREHIKRFDELRSQLELNQPSKEESDRLLAPFYRQGQILYDDCQKWRGAVGDRVVSISDPQQMDQFNQPDDSHLWRLFMCFANYPGTREAYFTFSSEKDMASDPGLKRFAQYREKHLSDVATYLQEAEQEMANINP